MLKQATLTDMLRKRKTTEQESPEDQQCRYPVIAYLQKYNDFTQNGYFVSSMARDYFREHSNIKYVFNLLMEKNGRQNVENQALLDYTIRSCMRTGKRNFHPYCFFQFASVLHESRGKLLLTYYTIETMEDLIDTEKYLEMFRIPVCTVNMTMNNLVTDGERKFNEAYATQTDFYENPRNRMNSTRYALKQYYEEKNLVEYFHIDEIDLEKLFEISTLDEVVNKIMKRQPENNYDQIAQEIFNALKENHSLAMTLANFDILPKFCLVINNLTPEQEKAASKNFLVLVSCTNFKTLVTMNRRLMPMPPEMTYHQKREERRKQLFIKYIRSKNKKRSPFNYLLWTADKEITEKVAAKYKVAASNNPVVHQKEPGPSNLSRETSFGITNQEPMIRYHQQQHAMIQDGRERKPQEYLGTFDTEAMHDDIRIISSQEAVIKYIKKDLKRLDREFYRREWENNKVELVINYIYCKVVDRDDKFFEVLNQLPEYVKDELQMNLEMNGDPVASSTQVLTPEIFIESVVEPAVAARPFHNNSDEPNDMVTNVERVCSDSHNISSINPENNKIKEEILTEKVLESQCDSGSVYVISEQPTTIFEISDDENADPNIVSNMMKGLDNSRADDYQRNLNIESQNEAIDNEFAEEYQLGARRHAIENMAIIVQNRKDKRIPISYANDSTSQDTGNENGHDIRQESNNLSIFLSTQLMYDYAAHAKRTLTFTFSKPLQERRKITWSSNSGRACFLIEISRLIYRRNQETKLFINVPQLSSYDVLVNKNEGMKEVLNLSQHDYRVIFSNLVLLESYEFSSSSERQPKEKHFEITVKNNLNLYFSTLPIFKKLSFITITKDNIFENEPITQNVGLVNDVTFSINYKILQKIKLLKK